jgi:hypothetical protein
MAIKSFRLWLLVFSLEQWIRDQPPDCDCDGAVGQTSGPIVQSGCLAQDDPQVVSGLGQAMYVLHCLVQQV